MAYNNVIYPLLRIKMAESNVDITMIADGVGMNRITLSRKFSGKNELSLPEARSIRDKFFPDVIVDELFDKDYKPKSKEGGAA